MNFSISKTEDGIIRYPQHSHEFYEIMHYVEGEGHLAFGETKCPFSPGTIIIVPAGVVHGSVSEHGFRNISIGGSFGHVFYMTEPLVMNDNAEQEGRILVDLIYGNRYGSAEYVNSLCMAYAHFLLKSIRLESEISQAVNRILGEIADNYAKPDLNVTELLQRSGYAEDYIRAQFRVQLNMTPIQCLHKVRIDHARTLIGIYGKSLSISQLAEKCGFSDPVYFSRCFKNVVGMSPKAYQSQKGNQLEL